MYREDQDALLARADSATREAERLRQENEAMRLAIAAKASQALQHAQASEALYRGGDLTRISFEERARLARHELRAFPVWAAGVLHFITFGLWSLIHFSSMHDRLPQASRTDPSAGKAIGFQFIPYYNLYWIFFNSLRLCDRMTLQYRLRNRRGGAPRGLVLAASVTTVIPYVNVLVAFPILWTIAACRLQATVNEIAAMPPDSWDLFVEHCDSCHRASVPDGTLPPG